LKVEAQLVDERHSPIVPARDRSGTFLVFSQLRCGSTTLRRLLNCHPQLRCLEEPFNPFNYGGQYLKRVSDLTSLDEVLSEIWRSYNGIKHTWCSDGWPFTDRPSFNTVLLLKPGQKVVYLRRRNLLQRVVSEHISRQAQVWGLFDHGDRERVRNSTFTAMNIENTKAQIRFDSHMLNYYRDLLVKNRSDFIEICYEDLYDTKGTAQGRLDLLNNIFTFLGCAGVSDESAVASIGELLDSREMKLNSSDTYRRITEVETLERECGSDETGWLLT
jgi:hypothetical protein